MLYRRLFSFSLLVVLQAAACKRAETATADAVDAAAVQVPVIDFIPIDAAVPDAVATNTTDDAASSVDAFAEPKPASCNPAARTGCAASEACDLQSTSSGVRTTVCRGVLAPPLADNAPCTRIEDCAAGFSCLETAPGAKRCLRLCSDNSDCRSLACSVSLSGTEFRACAAVCDPVTATGCEPGSACHPVASAAAQPAFLCVKSGAAAAWDACQTRTDCQAGLACDPNNNRCAHYCREDKDCKQAGATCSLPKGGALGTCRLPCEPFTAKGCWIGGGCSLFSGAPPATYCFPPGTGAHGSSCNTINDCRGGHVCVGAAGDTHCVRICRSGDNTACSGVGMQVCAAFSPALIVDGQGYGLCQ